MSSKRILLLMLAVAGLAACSQPDNKATTINTTPPVAKKPQMEEPFKYHKLIEVAPGRYYDVLSWGRGAKGGGAYMILRSDSSEQQYNTVNGDLEGPVVDVINSDLDVDGNPEILIQAKTVDTNRYTSVFVYEYKNDNAQKLDFPRLTASQRKGFRGQDRFYVKDDTLFRTFPVYEGTGAEAKPTGDKRLLAYTLHGSSFSVKQVSKDKDDDKSPAKDNTPVPAPVRHEEKKIITSSHRSSHKKTTKHKSEPKKKKRHRR